MRYLSLVLIALLLAGVPTQAQAPASDPQQGYIAGIVITLPGATNRPSCDAALEGFLFYDRSQKQTLACSGGSWVGTAVDNDNDGLVLPHDQDDTDAAIKAQYLLAENIKKDITILGVTGTLESGPSYTATGAFDETSSAIVLLGRRLLSNNCQALKGCMTQGHNILRSYTSGSSTLYPNNFYYGAQSNCAASALTNFTLSNGTTVAETISTLNCASIIQ
ncbi:MAG: hypothetical protein F4X17_16435 [Gemmatimonadetes bacterium]|nr:hypothetical protein [Gemmatimonadota bacterium]